MKTTYYKSELRFDARIIDLKNSVLTVEEKTVTCDCGETTGAIIYDNGNAIEKLILCESCWLNAANIDRD